MVRKIISRGIFGSFFLAGIVMIVVGIAGISISSAQAGHPSFFTVCPFASLCLPFVTTINTFPR